MKHDDSFLAKDNTALLADDDYNLTCCKDGVRSYLDLMTSSTLGAFSSNGHVINYVTKSTGCGGQ